jgi:hypothetical protein
MNRACKTTTVMVPEFQVWNRKPPADDAVDA